MASASSSREVIRHLNTLFQCGTVGQLSDRELLERFIATRDHGAEAAFAALVERHGAMVLGVCRRMLGNWHEAEDAFQATFLVLARKAKTIRGREQLASWLYGVARHTALDARARATRRQAKEKRLATMLPTEQSEPTDTSELRAILDEELARLPERTRAALILCELEGLSRRQAAGRLGISEGTLSSRLARGKEQLRDRLTRRGVGLSAAALTAALSGEARAAIVSPALIDSTITVATLVAAGSSLTGVASISVATLTQGVLKAMLIAKLKLVILGFASVALVTTGVGVVAQVPAPANRPAEQDRLKVVEQKLDRLLEVLGGSNRAVPAPTLPIEVPAMLPPAPPGPALTPADALPVEAEDCIGRPGSATIGHPAVVRGHSTPGTSAGSTRASLLPTRSHRRLRQCQVPFQCHLSMVESPRWSEGWDSSSVDSTKWSDGSTRPVWVSTDDELVPTAGR